MPDIPQELVAKAAAALLQQAQECGHTFPYDVEAYAGAALAAVWDDLPEAVLHKDVKDYTALVRADERRRVAEEIKAAITTLYG